MMDIGWFGWTWSPLLTMERMEDGVFMNSSVSYCLPLMVMGFCLVLVTEYDLKNAVFDEQALSIALQHETPQRGRRRIIVARARVERSAVSADIVF